MWRVAGRLPAVRQTMSLPVIKPSVCASCSHNMTVRQNSGQVPQPPPMSQAFEPGKNQEQTQSHGSGGGSSGKNKSGMFKPALAIGGVVGLGGLVLAYDENSRIAAVDMIPGLKPVFDTLGLSTERKTLPPCPPPPQTHRKVADNYNVINIAERSVNQMTVKPVECPPPKPVESQPCKPVAMSCSKSDTCIPPKHKGALITNIADDSVKFLLSGKRTSAEEEAIAKCKRDAERERCEYEEKKRNAKVQKAKEKQEAEAARHLAKCKHEEAEQEKQRLYEECKLAKNCALETMLSKEIGCTLELAQNAVTLNQLALDACHAHTTQLKKAMDADRDSVAQEYWPKICELREIRLCRVEQAKDATGEAERSLKCFLGMIDEAKHDEMTKSNPCINSYQKQAQKLASDLSQAINMLENADSMDQVMKYYYHMLQKDRLNFQRELEECLPDVKLGNKGSKLSEEELTSLLAHAHQRVFQLKKQLREHELMEEQRCQDVLRDQREKHDVAYNERLKQELEDQRCKCRIEMEKELMEQMDCQERRMREELVRQALAQNNHMNDMLKLQNSQLIEEFNQVTEQRCDFERSTYVESLAKHIAKIDGLIATLSEKSDVDKVLTDLRSLMSSTQCLMYTIAKEDPPNCTDYKVTCIADALARCSEASNGSQFVRTILNSIPQKARSCGIYTISSLERRFECVFEECKKVALFPNSSNIVSSSLSSIYSRAMFYTIKPRYTNEMDLNRCGTAGMSAKDLIVQAKYFMDKHCLAAAVKCMVQLDGIPKCLAQGWIDEARLFLEVSQAAEALYSYAMSKGFSQIL